MATYYASKSQLATWLSQLQGKAVFAPEPTARGAWVRRRGQDSPPPALEKPRAAQSAKGFFLPAVEAVARYGQQAGKAGGVNVEPVVLVGVRACELRAWVYLDRVMLGGDFVEPLHKARRESACIVSCDCVDCADTCWCVKVGGKPYVESGSDANLIALGDGYLAEPLSDKGKQLLAEGRADWPEATSQQLEQRQRLRQGMVERLMRQNAAFPGNWTDEAPPKLPEGDGEGWQRHAADCVECGACTNICPTCHCFYLFDHAIQPKTAERVRNWDSCLYATYHRMAGGPGMKLSPRPELRNRLANRILHKFVYSPQQYRMLGCTGCGRCVDACLGAIDIRTVVEDLKR